MPARTLTALTVAFLVVIASGCTRTDAAPEVAPAASSDPLPEITMYKSPTCGCCTAWGEYMEAEGFPVVMIDVPNIGEKRTELGTPLMLGSCHTAVVEGYLVEGHVPADDVRRLLREKPDALGIAVPGMPIGSPGMEVPGRAPQAYETYLFTEAGQTTVFARH